MNLKFLNFLINLDNLQYRGKISCEKIIKITQ